MKKILLLGMTMLLMLGVIAGCGSDGDDQEVLKIYNWGLYMDPQILADFEAETGIKVQQDEFPTNEDMYTKVKSGTTSYDLLVPSDYMIERMINEGMLAEINFDNIPNFVNIDDSLKGLSYDAENQYSVPYTWGTVGIVYNTDEVDVDPSDIDWDILFSGDYPKEILMSDSVRDSLGVALKYLGYSQNSRDINELEEAKQLLIEQKPDVLAYVVDEVRDLMLSGEANIALVWSGEGMLLEQDSDNLKFVLPESGANMWVDAMVIPEGAANQEAAEMFINYICDPEVSYTLCDYIGYATPNAVTRDTLIDEELINNPNAYPSAEYIETKTEMFTDTSDFLEEYNRIWTEISVAK